MKSIKKFFTQEFEVQRPTSETEFGRSKEVFNSIGTFKGRFDRANSVKEIVADKKTYTITDNLYCDVIDVKFGDKIIKASSEEYRVVNKTNPFDKNNHLELGLERII